VLGSYSTLKLLFETTDIKSTINERNSYGSTPLHWVTFSKIETIDKIELFITHGANVNIQDNKGETVLHKAVLYGQNTEVISLLIEAGADITFQNNQGESSINLSKWNVELFTFLTSLYNSKKGIGFVSPQKFFSDYNPNFWNDAFFKKYESILSKSSLYL